MKRRSLLPALVVALAAAASAVLLAAWHATHSPLRPARAALLIVDAQPAFACSNGSLPVRRGEEVVDALRRLLQRGAPLYELVAFSLDCHPPSHISFASAHQHADAAAWGTTAGVVILGYGARSARLLHGSTWSMASPATASNSEPAQEEPTEEVVWVQQRLWPDHCVAGTPEAQLHPRLRELLQDGAQREPLCPPPATGASELPALRHLHLRAHNTKAVEALVVLKGTLPHLDAPSPFSDSAHLLDNGEALVVQQVDHGCCAVHLALPTCVMLRAGLHFELQARRVTTVHVAGLALDVCVEATCLDALRLGSKVLVGRAAAACHRSAALVRAGTNARRQVTAAQHTLLLAGGAAGGRNGPRDRGRRQPHPRAAASSRRARHDHPPGASAGFVELQGVSKE